MHTTCSLTISRCILCTPSNHACPPATMHNPQNHAHPLASTPLCNHTCPPATNACPPATKHAPCNHACPPQPHMPPNNHTCPLATMHAPCNHACPHNHACHPSNHTCHPPPPPPQQPCTPPRNHTCTPPCGQNSWHMLLKILPCPKLRLRAVNMKSDISAVTTMFTTLQVGRSCDIN